MSNIAIRIEREIVTRGVRDLNTGIPVMEEGLKAAELIAAERIETADNSQLEYMLKDLTERKAAIYHAKAKRSDLIGSLYTSGGIPDEFKESIK